MFKNLSTEFKILAAVLAVATLGAIAALIIIFIGGDDSSTPDNVSYSDLETPVEDLPDPTPLSAAEKEARMNELYVEYNIEVTARAEELSATYFDQFITYRSQIKPYNAANAYFATEDLKKGTGTEVTKGFYNYSAYYIGWLPDGTIFDTSFDTETCVNTLGNPTSLKFPLAGGQMIEGWNQGIIGMKLGGVRKITMQSDLAYGDDERGCIPAGSPLTFIVLLIPKIEEVPYPDEYLQLYEELYGYY